MRRPPHRPLLAKRLPSDRCPPAPAPGTVGLSREWDSPHHAAGASVGEHPGVSGLQGLSPENNTEERAFRVHTQAARPCPPQFPLHSLFKWDSSPPCLSPQKGCPNSFYHGGPPPLPAVPKSASYLQPVYMKPPARDSAFLPRRPVPPALGK